MPLHDLSGRHVSVINVARRQHEEQVRVEKSLDQLPALRDGLQLSWDIRLDLVYRAEPHVALVVRQRPRRQVAAHLLELRVPHEWRLDR